MRVLATPLAESPSGFLTLSVGVAACVPQAESQAEALLAAADQALYPAKAQGRDLVLPGVLPHSSP